MKRKVIMTCIVLALGFLSYRFIQEWSLERNLRNNIKAIQHAYFEVKDDNIALTKLEIELLGNIIWSNYRKGNYKENTQTGLEKFEYGIIAVFDINDDIIPVFYLPEENKLYILSKWFSVKREILRRGTIILEGGKEMNALFSQVLSRK